MPENDELRTTEPAATPLVPDASVALLGRAAPPAATTTAPVTMHAPTSATDVVAAFLAGRRTTTLRAYRGSLNAFRAFLGVPTVADAARTLLGATAGDANRVALAWRNSMVDAALVPLTVNSRLAALRALVALARLQGLVHFHVEVPGVRADRCRDTRGPGRRGVRALLEQVEVASTPKGLRDRALVRLLTDLALRRAEVVALDVHDVDLVEGTVAVLGKGRSSKTKLTLPEPTNAALAAWAVVRGTEPGPLFPNFCRCGSGSGVK